MNYKSVKSRILFTNEWENMIAITLFAYVRFFSTHKQPKRPAIVNIIRYNMLKYGWEKEDYETFDEYYSYDEKKVRDCVSSKFNNSIIICLCQYLGIKMDTSIDDEIKNYDFEQKPICHARKRSPKDKELFIKEFEDSWSDYTLEKWLKEQDENTLTDLPF